MKKIKLEEDVYAFEYDELSPYLTYVYLIIRNKRLFIIDTFCGSDYMDEIKEMYPHYEYCVMNTHYHFDHIWGNAAFHESMIYAHDLCKHMILKYGEEDLRANHTFLKGEKEIVVPGNLIHDSFLFKEEGIELIYTPGHSLDSISVLDQKHQWLFAGDNLEKPIIQFEKENISVYKQTLQRYLQLPVKQFFGGHTLTLTKKDIQFMMDYLESVERGDELSFEDQHIQALHLKNLM